jgi:hypothetical protein
MGVVGLLRTWRQARPYWDFAAELLLKAAETGKRRDVEAATAQMEREEVAAHTAAQLARRTRRGQISVR